MVIPLLANQDLTPMLLPLTITEANILHNYFCKSSNDDVLKYESLCKAERFHRIRM